MPTTSRGYRYPLGSAAPNVPVDLANLAGDLNTDVGAVAKTGTIVCTSGTRPASPVEGQKIWQTDTKSELIYTSSTWRRTGVFDQETVGVGSATDSTTVGAITSTSFVPGSPVNGFSFVAPPSGGVFVNVGGRIIQTANTNETNLGFEVRSGGTVGAGTILVSASSFRSLTCGRAVNASAVAVLNATRRVKINAGTLTPGATFNIQNMHNVAPGGTGTIEYRDLFIEPVF